MLTYNFIDSSYKSIMFKPSHYTRFLDQGIHNTRQRTLPCFSTIATGFCTYGERCQFIHDYRCKNEICYTKHKRILSKSNNNKSFNDIGHSLFFWPALTYQSETYEVPEDVLLQSMWYHYLISLSEDNIINQKENRSEINLITQKSRLEVFQNLSKNRNRLPIFTELERCHYPSG